jgi:uncharacterized protein YjbJ (UPF0337 family)
MSINVQGLQGHWNQMKGELKKKWGQLTDDDLAWSGGNIDHVVGRIQQRTGETREAIEKQINHMSSQAGSMVAQAGSMVASAAEQAGSYAQDLSHRFRDQYGQLSEQAHEGYVSVRDHVSRNPIPWLSIAFGVGVLTGLLVRNGHNGSGHRFF